MPIQVPPPSNQINDTANIKAALATALLMHDEVVLGLGTYQIYETLTLGGGPQISGVSLRGVTKFGTRLQWVGAPDGTLLFIDHNKGFRVSDFSMQAGAKGTTTGIKIGRSGGLWNGTMAGCGRVENVGIDNFAKGVHAGNAQGTAASEIVFSLLDVQRAGSAVYAESYNTLNLRFEMLMLASCHVGIEAQQAGMITVDGGSASGNDYDFYLRPGGRYAIRDFRSEAAGIFLQSSGTSAPTIVTVDNCEVQAIRGEEGLAIAMTGGARLVMQSSQILGKVGLNFWPGNPPVKNIVLIGNSIMDAVPYRLTTITPGGGSIDGVRITALGNLQVDSGGNAVSMFPDFIGECGPSARPPVTFG